MTAHCNKGCGQTWPRHPALEVDCPQCQAPSGRRCRRPSGHGCNAHAARVLAAYDAGHFGVCPWECCRPKERPLPTELPGGEWRPQGSLFDA